ncbi:MAG: GIY-YIG nuclease family protein [Omnitrophica bacterium]|nr:GIY-YIG nuclease family protein [Candidatus Omnitrophota bacterium]
MSWYTYIIQCRDGTFYTGITNNLKRRICEHNSGEGCRYTRCRYPVKLIHSEKYLTRAKALKREAHIKALPRNKKSVLASD